MDDLIARLRNPAWIVDVSQGLILEPEVTQRDMAVAADKLERLRGEYERGYREALEVAANDIDCGGQPYCTATKLDDGSCIYQCSRDCAHEEAENIRSLTPPVNRPQTVAGESNT